MNVSRKLCTLLIVLFVLMAIAVAVGFRARSQGLVIRSALAPFGVVFTLSNSSDRVISGWYDGPQIRLNAQWRIWKGSPRGREHFYLLPCGVTNLVVSVPQTGADVRVPFAWGYDKRSGFQKIAPRIHVRLANLMNTLRNSGNVSGWNNAYGYLPDATTYYYTTNTEVAGSANRSQPFPPTPNQSSGAAGGER